MLCAHNIRFDAASRRIWRGPREVRLTRKAFDLLALLIDRRPAAVSKDEIHERLWPATFVADITLHALISELRRALGDSAAEPRFIRTVHGFGYAFIAPMYQTAQSAQMEPRHLRGWLSGPRGRLSLFDGDNVFGRGVADVIELPSATISRRHAVIRFADDAWLEDLGSKNGTYLGDEPVTTPVRLVDGSRVRLGSLLFTFRTAGVPGASTTQSDAERGASATSRPTR